jgi:capsule biosynthesis phosphatase
MKVVILCGGSGTRLEDYSFPKPLNMIYGKPSISYCLQNLPKEVDTLHFIVAPHLQKYNFDEIIINQFKDRKCIFHHLPYFTRGPIESALLGIQSIQEIDESIVFLDNDVLYNFPTDMFKDHDTAFLGYANDKSNSEAYSFLQINDTGRVINYKEKKRISDLFCCGVYGFKSIEQFRTIASEIVNSETSELYMSLIYQYMLKHDIPINGVEFNGQIYHIGSLNELRHSKHVIPVRQMRVCFDLDNTLVTYPTIPGDYSSVKPNLLMIELARKLKKEGHTIIIHTARRMTTHGHNIGAVIRDIGLVTFNTLAEFDIPYDEIIFGKPIADMYIDDRAVNPYYNTVQLMGYLTDEKVLPPNMLKPNKYNTITLENNKIVKTGPPTFLNGEIFYYQHIPQDSLLASYYPQYYSSQLSEPAKLVVEYIKSIPIYTLYKSELMTEKHMDDIFLYIDLLHNTHGPVPNMKDIMDNYICKLKSRFTIKEDYPFIDAEAVQNECLKRLETYTPSPTGFIHGDLWFSNILLDYNSNIKVIDMKGQVNGILTTGGDKMYDYGKLYQSILGYDLVLNNNSISAEYTAKIKQLFMNKLAERSISHSDLTTVTFSLVMGTLHSIYDYTVKQRVWDWITSTFVNS